MLTSHIANILNITLTGVCDSPRFKYQRGRHCYMGSPVRLAVSNQKGGVGKTTTTVHLAGALAQRGHDVVVVDMDPQGNLTTGLGFEDYFDNLDDDNALDSVLVNHDPVEPTMAQTDEFDIVRANIQMNETLRSRLNGVNSSGQRLKSAMEPIEDEYDYVLVDAPPSLDNLTTNALVYTRNLLVPTFPGEMSTSSLKLLMRQVESIQQYWPELGYVGFVVGRVEDSGPAEATVRQFESMFGDTFPVWKIRKRVTLERAISKSNGSIFIHTEDTDMELNFCDMAAWLDNEFDVESQSTIRSMLPEDDIVDAVVDGQTNIADLEATETRQAVVDTLLSRAMADDVSLRHFNDDEDRQQIQERLVDAVLAGECSLAGLQSTYQGNREPVVEAITQRLEDEEEALQVGDLDESIRAVLDEAEADVQVKEGETQ